MPVLLRNTLLIVLGKKKSLEKKKNKAGFKALKVNASDEYNFACPQVKVTHFQTGALTG